MPGPHSRLPVPQTLLSALWPGAPRAVVGSSSPHARDEDTPLCSVALKSDDGKDDGPTDWPKYFADTFSDLFFGGEVLFALQVDQVKLDPS